MSFAFVYARRADPGDPASPAAKRLFVARAWPWDEPGDLETPGEASWAEDLTGERWPRSDAEGGRPKGLSYLSLPLAVVIRFEFPRNGAARAVEHTVRLPSSGWYDLMTRR
ncbi:MAG: hypothetical protein M5U26_00345 [Planctomycetota bacterium]|nr:hypothetical protein [Planctomycetota bacterium]